jgi:hypothetical protein
MSRFAKEDKMEMVALVYLRRWTSSGRCSAGGAERGHQCVEMTPSLNAPETAHPILAKG